MAPLFLVTETLATPLAKLTPLKRPRDNSDLKALPGTHGNAIRKLTCKWVVGAQLTCDNSMQRRNLFWKTVKNIINRRKHVCIDTKE